MFLCWYSTEAMAATLPAGMLHFTILCFPLGVASYVNTFVAQYEGAGPARADRRGRLAGRLGRRHRDSRLAGHDPLRTGDLSPCRPFAGRGGAWRPPTIRLLAFGAGGAVIAGAQSSFFTGRGETRVVMLVSCTTALVNVVLDYAWIFGRCGFPAMGIAGAGLATVVAQWCGARSTGGSWSGPRIARSTSWRRTPFRRALFARLLRYGGPNGLQMLVEVSGFTLFLLLVGRLGSGAMAATTLAFNVNSVAFVPMLGMGVAVATIVGQQLGRNRPNWPPGPPGPPSGWRWPTWARWPCSTCWCPTCS